ncbi:low temperature requirement protein A [Plantactinospora endophytica]|uniref:Low temperature requirement protein A n=1 Tax=Plantactinospora endophytica TaxID=673535 RepID=A0ABQ4E0M2_9ACTN|nr:low temperature requirement protein A [Plantactinospora endophytica]GIG88255.1 low temperature requirement protein A [Plantactinospora endophytica]
MTAAAGRTTGKGVTWEELFFDLAFVFALTQFSRLLHQNPEWSGIGRALILFVPVYWAWGGVTLYADQRNLSPVLDRLGILALGLGSLLMALTIPRAYDDLGLLFVTIYVTSRALLATLALRRLPGWRALFVGPYGVFLLTGPLLVAGALTEGAARIGLWAAAAVSDLVSPWVSRYLVTPTRAEPLHYSHRYGLLIILVFGESVIQVGAVAADRPLTLVRLTAIAASYALVGGLWWAYFSYGLPSFRRALEHAPNQADLRRAVLVYGHLLFSFGIITVSVGLADMVPTPLDALGVEMATLLFGGTALFMATFAYTHWRIRGRIAWHRVGAAVLSLVLLPLATLIPALVMVAALFLVVVGMAVGEELATRRRRDDRHDVRSYGDQDPADRGPASQE